MILGNWKVRVLYLCGALALAAAVLIELDERRYPAMFAGLTPLEVPLSTPLKASLRAPFTAVWTERHEVALVFHADTTDLGVSRILARAELFVTERGEPPNFDFEWRVLEGSKIVGQGPREHRPTGWFGVSGARGYTFGGDFPAEAGHTYILEASFGPDFQRFLPAAPSIQVGVAAASASVGLALNHGRAPIFQYSFGFLGLFFVAWAAILSRKARKVGSTGTQHKVLYL